MGKGKEKFNEFLGYIDNENRYKSYKRALLYITLNALNKIEDLDEWFENNDSYTIELPELDHDSAFSMNVKKLENPEGKQTVRLGLMVRYGAKDYDIYHVMIEKKEYQVADYSIYVFGKYIPVDNFTKELDFLFNNILKNYINYSGETPEDVFRHYIVDEGEDE